MWTFRHFTSNWKKVKIDNNKLMTIQEHLLCCNYSPSFEDFSILTREGNDFKLKIMESLLIARDKPILNKADSSLPLELFEYKISGYHLTFCHIIWCPLILLFVQFSLLCYGSFILSKTECKSIYYHFRRDHEYRRSFRKLAKNKWICWETYYFSSPFSRLLQIIKIINAFSKMYDVLGFLNFLYLPQITQ